MGDEEKKEEVAVEDDVDEPEEEVEFLGKAPKKKETRITFFHPPLPKPGKKFDPEEKKENELLRMFQVQISNIEIVNERKEVIDPFLRFIIGGSFFTQVKKRGKDDIIYIPQGELGIVHTTDVAKFLEGGQSALYERVISTVYTASFFQMETERLHVEVWDSENFYLNQFIAYNSLPLLDIVDGPMQHTVQCYPYIENFQQGKLNATVNMKVNLAEIWDFNLEFMDWKTTSLANEDNPDATINSYIVITMDTKKNIGSTIQSEVIKNSLLPYWAKLTNGRILFRGTYHELKQQQIQVTLYNKNLIGADQLGSKIIQLKEVIDINFAKADMIIHKGGAKAVTDDDDLDKAAQSCIIQGTVNTGSFPKFRQMGEDDLVGMEEKYLCVKINEANVFGGLSDGGDAKVWVDVQWSGITKSTREFKRQHVNQIIYFKIPIPADEKKSEAKLEQYLSDELSTKSEFSVTVWADTHKTTIDNIGSGKMCLSAIAGHGVAYQDQEFIDPRSKEKYTYQARVYSGTIRLQSATKPNASNSVSCSVWFQKDLPFPGVDLSKLKPKEGDAYPVNLVDDSKKLLPDFVSIYSAVLGLNFDGSAWEPSDRLFDQTMVTDQYTQRHLLPLFLSKITNPDQSILKFDEDGFPIRGLRTFGEIAHYVRCVPYQPKENIGNSENQLWNSPDFTMTIKTGSEEDHALLMVSIFRTVKYEDQVEFKKFAKDMKAKTVTKKDRDKELLTVDVGGGGGKKEEGDDEEEKGDAEGDATAGAEATPTPEATPGATKKGGIGGIGGLGGNKEEEEAIQETVDDRVFVCLGKSVDGLDTRYVWVMTINRDWDTITFWEVKNHKSYILRGRIMAGQEKYISAYLAPNLSPEEKAEMEKLRAEQKALYESMHGGTEADDQLAVEVAPASEGDEDEDDDNEEESEKLSDSSFQSDIERIINYSDMDQSLKGENINHIGQLDALGRDKKDDLKQLNYQDLGAGEQQEEKPKNKFFQAQDDKRKKDEAKRPDKHLLPVEQNLFKDPKTGKCPTKEVEEWGSKLPFQSIDIIFNHKNIWGNLQNPNPAVIWYHIHDNTKWLPLIADPCVEHPKIIEDRKSGEDDVEADDAPKAKKAKKKGKDGKDAELIKMQLSGDFMKPFLSFYDPKAMEPPLNEKMVNKIEAKIMKEVEIAIKQVRSSRNLNANLKNNRRTRAVMRKYIDYLEDVECQRIPAPKPGGKPTAQKNAVNKEVMKLVPANYNIAILPAFFNHTDGERIRTIIRDTSNEFLIQTKKQVMFTIAVKVFPYNSNVNSVRVVLVKQEENDGVDANGKGGDEKSSKRSRSAKSKSNKSKSDQGKDPQDIPPKK